MCAAVGLAFTIPFVDVVDELALTACDDSECEAISSRQGWYVEVAERVFSARTRCPVNSEAVIFPESVDVWVRVVPRFATTTMKADYV